jgi:hypothetical protein
VGDLGAVVRSPDRPRRLPARDELRPRNQIACLPAQIAAEAETCACPARFYDLRAALRDWVDDAPIFLDVEDGAAR